MAEINRSGASAESLPFDWTVVVDFLVILGVVEGRDGNGECVNFEDKE